MTVEKARRIVLAQRPQGKPTAADFRFEEFDLPEAGAGELLLRTKFLSLDPYMRGRMSDAKSYAEPVPVGGVITAQSLCEVVTSYSPDYAVGDLVLAGTGWQSHFVCGPKNLRKIKESDAPVSTSLGVLGMPGFTAYSGIKVIGQPKKGETVVVASATGPVGSLVGQLAQRAGARAIGIAGGAKKCKSLIDFYGFDAAIDHKSSTFAEDLKAACPDGVDVYFENVGGEVWLAVAPLLNKFARVPLCGLIAQYNGAQNTAHSADALMRMILTKSIDMRGFINFDFIELMPQFLKELTEDVRSGKIKYQEDIVLGLENAPEAFMGMLEGKNHGKLLIAVS